MKDSINRKAQRKERSTMVETSDDRNGVMVNRTRCRGTCDKLNKRHSNPSDRGEVQKSSSQIHAKSECCTALL